MAKIVLIRHGESEWNLKGLFTGWVDVDLSPKGRLEAAAAGRLLKAEGFIFDQACTSLLKRAINTLDIVLEEMDLKTIPIDRDWRLNERHYGNLQGLNKIEMAKQFGEAQVKIWRRSYDVRPPDITSDNPYGKLDEDLYKGVPVPKAECLKDVVERVTAYWQEKIIPLLRSDKRVIISASGNSLRALIKYLDNLAPEAVIDLNIPTGVPIVYELDADLKPVKHYYLGDQEEIATRIKAVENQGRIK
jgi:2,3-bisphosphoglycerate-dependent phosphoglycerate mutase